MKKADLLFFGIVAAVLAPLFVSDVVYDAYKTTNATHPYFMAFLKFMILSSIGEMVGLRIKQGVYSYQGYGIIPRAIVWGFLGVLIAFAMNIFKNGTPVLLQTLGFENACQAMMGSFSWDKLITAFCISTAMNTIFAPVFMTVHKITDTHILNCNGSLASLITPISFGKILSELNWSVQWNFVFKKTIPLFWIPAHTITFMLPGEYQVLFAASLSIVLGILLSVAAVMSREK